MTGAWTTQNWMQSEIYWITCIYFINTCIVKVKVVPYKNHYTSNWETLEVLR
jgi:hypothetical protein